MEPEENPTAAILQRFAAKHTVNISEVKYKQLQARHETSQQAKVLTEAVRKEERKSKQLAQARKARQKGGE